jgi:hypothetical protein
VGRVPADRRQDYQRQFVQPLIPDPKSDIAGDDPDPRHRRRRIGARVNRHSDDGERFWSRRPIHLWIANELVGSLSEILDDANNLDPGAGLFPFTAGLANVPADRLLSREHHAHKRLVDDCDVLAEVRIANAASPIPKGLHSITAQLTLDNADETIDWYSSSTGPNRTSRKWRIQHSCS